jgi:hypothetical protein
MMSIFERVSDIIRALNDTKIFLYCSNSAPVMVIKVPVDDYCSCLKNTLDELQQEILYLHAKPHVQPLELHVYIPLQVKLLCISK